MVRGAILEKWASLGSERSFLGYPTTDELATPDGIGRFNHFQGGSIYWTPATGAHEIHGAIVQKWASLGFERSFLGYPVTDEMNFPPEAGRISCFQGGSIYWWPDTGAIELNDVVVHYTGLACFSEMDWDQGSDSDEPYVVMGVISPNGTSAHRSQVYEDVDSGDRRPDLLEIYRGKPHGLTISVLLMEHDEGDPDKYKAAMLSAVGGAFAGITTLIALIPVAGPIIASTVGPLLGAVAPTVANELNNLLDTADDKIGEVTIAFSAKDMIVLATRTQNSWDYGVGFKAATPLLSGGGADYKAHFGFIPA